jgi:aryl-alcohol dehydrogenase-like predicted oxidoreductase
MRSTASTATASRTEARGAPTHFGGSNNTCTDAPGSIAPGGCPALAGIAQEHGASPAQIALAWLLARSPVVLPIPGTNSIDHLEENWDARGIALSKAEVAAIAAAG